MSEFQQVDSVWNSPWGKVQNAQVQSRVLSLQPTSGIELSAWNELGFSKASLGYEPGPIFMGRGQVPTLLDLWGAEAIGIQGIDERRSFQGLQKLCADIILNSENKKILCLGALAPLFGNEFKKRLLGFEIEILPETETSFLLSQGH